MTLALPTTNGIDTLALPTTNGIDPIHFEYDEDDRIVLIKQGGAECNAIGVDITHARMFFENGLRFIDQLPSKEAV